MNAPSSQEKALKAPQTVPSTKGRVVWIQTEIRGAKAKRGERQPEQNQECGSCAKGAMSETSEPMNPLRVRTAGVGPGKEEAGPVPSSESFMQMCVSGGKLDAPGT